MLAYTNASRNSGINNWEVTKRHIDGDRDVQSRFARIRDIAGAMREALASQRLAGSRTADRRGVGQSQRPRAGRDDTEHIDAMLAAAGRVGATGGKVCGAGGGGCLFCIGEPDDVPAIRQALANAGARLLDFHVDPQDSGRVRRGRLTTRASPR